MKLAAGLIFLLTTAAAILVSQTPELPAVPADDPVLKAMRDEMERSRQLRIAGGSEAPYFFSYSLTDADNLRVSAALGAVYNVQRSRFRSPSIEVRVGSYDFDNTDHQF